MAATNGKPRVVKKPPAAKAKQQTTAAGTPRQIRRPVITSDVTKAVVDQIPPTGYESNARKMVYANVLAEVREKVGAGRPVVIATFAGRSGATQVKKALEGGKYPVDGDVANWAFDARRTDDSGSQLYATLLP